MEDSKAKLQENVSGFEKELKVLLDKYNLKMNADLDFPQYRIVPEEIKLALLIINKHGGRVITTYSFAKEDKK